MTPVKSLSFSRPAPWAAPLSSSAELDQCPPGSSAAMAGDVAEVARQM
jgi:hypothetical protein